MISLYAFWTDPVKSPWLAYSLGDPLERFTVDLGYLLADSVCGPQNSTDLSLWHVQFSMISS